MNKKGIILPIYSILLTSSAYAADEGTITWMIEQFGELVFNKIPQMGDIGFRFLLFILVFTAANFGLKKIPNMEGKTAGIVSFIISLASVILINGDIIKAIFATYGFVIVFLFGILIPLATFWFIKYKLPDDAHAIKAAIYLGMGIALLLFVSWAKGYPVIIGMV